LQAPCCTRRVSAVLFGFAEQAPVATLEVALSGIGELGCGLQRSFYPFVELVLCYREGADIGAAGLVNRHGNRVNVIDAIEDFQSAERVKHHLRIVVSIDLYALTVLIVHDVKRTVRDDDAVAGAKTTLHEAGVIEALFNQNNGICAFLLCLVDQLHDECSVADGTVLHLLVVVGEIFGGVLRFHAERLFQLVLTKAVGVCAFGGVVAAFILVAFAEPRRWRAVNPAM
jgi:hypothetical protein